MTSYTVNQETKDTNKNLDRKLFVTKSINFNKCRQVSDVAFGFQEQTDATAKCIRLNTQQKININNKQVPFVNEQACDPKEVNKNNKLKLYNSY